MLRMAEKNPSRLHTVFRHSYNTTTRSHTLANPWLPSHLQCPTACFSLDMAPPSRHI
jgi:hypothetical protein